MIVNKGKIIYKESKQNSKRTIKKFMYLAKALFLLIAVVIIMILIIIDPASNYKLEYIIFLLILLGMGLLQLWSFMIMGNLKVYARGITVPETTFFGKEKFVSFDEINRIVIEKVADTKFITLEKKGAVKKEEIYADDILHSFSEEDIYDLKVFLRSIKGKIKVVHKK